LKIFHRNSDLNHKQQVFKSYEAEKNIQNLKHKNLIKYFGCNNAKSEHDTAFIVYEFGGKLNLNQVIIDSKIDLTQSIRKSFSLDLVNALEFIHLNNIVHMDLKPANIIVTDSLVLKLTDFGCSVKIDSYLDDNNNTCHQEKQCYVNSRWTAGTWFYRAPELFRNDSQNLNNNLSNVSTSCDIYSLGICMWQLLTREFPYNGENPHVIIYQIVSKGLRPEYPTTTNNNNDDLEFEKLYRLIVEKSWDSDSNKRLSAKSIKELFTNK
jgi:proto-oncogene serine/threonine-protein kinase mos